MITLEATHSNDAFVFPSLFFKFSSDQDVLGLSADDVTTVQKKSWLPWKKDKKDLGSGSMEGPEFSITIYSAENRRTLFAFTVCPFSPLFL